MLDTIALTFQRNEFEVLDMAKFSPSAQGLFLPPYYPLGARGNFSCYQNPTKTELESGNYKPRLTITKRKAHAGFALSLRCEFSAPKLLLGNNFDELRETDLLRMVDVLQEKLAWMGVRVMKETIRKAQVSAIHYSKNIALTDYSTCAMVLGELGKVNLNRRLDLAKTDYRNEGYCIRYHANSYEIAFYDKIKDMQQAKTSEKRALEKDYAPQRDLFSRTRYVKPLDVLRMEVRLGNRTKLKAMLKTLGHECPMMLESLFSESISQGLLRHFWRNATVDMPLLAFSQFKPEDIYQALCAESKGEVKPSRILQRIGAMVILHTVGMPGLRSLVSQHSTDRSWQRLKKDLGQIDTSVNMRYAAVRNVGTALEVFAPMRLKDYVAKNGYGHTKGNSNASH